MTSQRLDPGRQEDAAARHRAQTQFDRPLVLEAGAGTGKTSTLVARLLHWTLGPGWERAQADLQEASNASPPSAEATARRVLQRVLAITFTEAAATQMASRVALALIALTRDAKERDSAEDRALAGFRIELLDGTLDQLRRRATALLGSLDHLAAQTFHSWCRGLLAQYPLEAGVHPAFLVDADGLVTEQLVDETLDDSLGDLYADDPAAPAVRLLTEHIGASVLRAQLLSLAVAGVPADELERERFAGGALRPLFDALRSAAGEALRLLRPAAAQKGATTVVKDTVAMTEGVDGWTVDYAHRNGDAAALEVALGELRNRAPTKRLKTLRDWSHARFHSNWEREHLADLGDELPVVCGRLYGLLRDTLRLQPLRFLWLCRALAPPLRRIQEEKRRRGILSFDDLLDRAAALLARNAAVRAAQRARCDQLLVDEFQDTDRRQCELIRLLALSGAEASRPGLFIVGDPKQSLYGWREADLAAYARFLREIEAAGGDVLDLNVNFRSVPSILREVERVVAPVMRPAEGLQPAFKPLLPCAELDGEEGFRDASHRPVEYWVTWTDEANDDASGRTSGRTRAAAAAEVEFDAVARDLTGLRESGVAWRSIGVLLRSRSRLTDLLDTLRRADIPYQVEGERTYFLRREIIEATALLHLVAQPRDRLSLVTVMRSAWVGVPDAALLPLLERRFDEILAAIDGPDHSDVPRLQAIAREVAAVLPDSLPGLTEMRGWELNLIAAVDAVGRLRRALREASAGEFVDQMRDFLLIDATEANRMLGAFRTANLDRFFGQLERTLESDADISGLLRFLRRAVEDSRQMAAAPLAQSADDAVQIMTIHGAKGLDFDHVYLLQTAAAGRGQTIEDFSARRPTTTDEAWELVLHGAPSPGWPLQAAAERRREAAERVRLLYVAMTRARKRLVISGNWPPSPRPTTPDAARQLQHLLEHREDLPPDLAALSEQSAEETGVEAGHAYWRFPTVQQAEPSTAGKRAPEWIPSADELTRIFAEQNRSRSAAEARQSHPLLERATSVGIEADAFREEETTLGSDDASRFADEALAADPATALRVGTLIHQAIERWRPERDFAAELARLREWSASAASAGLSPENARHAVERLHRLLDAFTSEALEPRWRRALRGILARELPVLVPWRTESGPLAALTGAIDLIYREPDTGRTVLVDFKTDRLASVAAAASRVERYRGQADAYRLAVQSALELEAPPDFEFWFLDGPAVVRLQDGAT